MIIMNILSNEYNSFKLRHHNIINYDVENLNNNKKKIDYNLQGKFQHYKIFIM